MDHYYYYYSIPLWPTKSHSCSGRNTPDSPANGGRSLGRPPVARATAEFLRSRTGKDQASGSLIFNVILSLLLAEPIPSGTVSRRAVLFGPACGRLSQNLDRIRARIILIGVGYQVHAGLIYRAYRPNPIAISHLARSNVSRVWFVARSIQPFISRRLADLYCCSRLPVACRSGPSCCVLCKLERNKA